MKTGVILTLSEKHYSVKRFQEEAAALGFSLTLVDPSSLGLSLSTSQGPELWPVSLFPEFVLHRISGARWDDYDWQLSRAWKAQGAQIYNDLEPLRLTRSKSEQLWALAQAQVPIVPTFQLRAGGPISQAPFVEKMQARLFSQTEDFITDCYVLKLDRGNQGIGTTLVRGKDALHSLLDTFWGLRDQRFVVQPLVKPQREWRVFLLKGAPCVALERSPGPGEFRANYHVAKEDVGRCVLRPLNLVPENVLHVAQEAFQVIGAFYGTVDLFELKSGGALVLEVNTVPGLEQVEQLSQINLTKMILSEGPAKICR